MKKIVVISSSVRDGRLSHRVALFLRDFIARRTGAGVEIADLREYDFPLFHERFSFMVDPDEKVVDFAERIKGADGVMIVTPVYNGSFPASLKNAIDLLYAEWRRKPLSIVSVSDGKVPGIATVQQLQVIMMKIGARVASPLYTVIEAADYGGDGTPPDRAFAEKMATPAVDELMWLVEKSTEV